MLGSGFAFGYEREKGQRVMQPLTLMLNRLSCYYFHIISCIIKNTYGRSCYGLN